LLWLHGFEENAESQVPTFSKENLDLPPSCRIVLITAKEAELTSHGGKKIPSWFDCKSLTYFPDEETFTKEYLNDNFNQNQLKSTIRYINVLLKKEIQKLGGDSTKVFLGGFGQGASVALAFYLTRGLKLGGIVCCSGANVLAKDISDLKKLGKGTTPLFLHHGQEDPVIPVSFAKIQYD
jgi:phospholipase/carboxylesterase